MAFGGDEGQRGKARGGLEGKCATVPSAREGAMDMGSWGRFSQIPFRDGVAGAGGPFARGVGGTFRTIAVGKIRNRDAGGAQTNGPHTSVLVESLYECCDHLLGT